MKGVIHVMRAPCDSFQEAFPPGRRWALRPVSLIMLQNEISPASIALPGTPSLRPPRATSWTHNSRSPVPIFSADGLSAVASPPSPLLSAPMPALACT